MNVGLAVGSRTIANWQIDEAQIELGSSEEQVEITEWIKLPEISPVPRDSQIIFPEQDFRATQRIFDFLTEQPTKGESEDFIGHHVQKLHRFLFHGIDQSNAISEISRSGTGHLIKFWQ